MITLAVISTLDISTNFKKSYSEILLIQQFRSVSDILKSKNAYDILLVDNRDCCELNEIVTLRQDNRYKYSLIYSLVAPTTGVSCLIDGTIPPPSLIIGEHQSVLERQSIFLGGRDAEMKDEELLAYLWINGSRGIYPYKNWHSQHHYFYPLLSVFSDNTTLAFHWLARLQSEGWLRASELQDRIRLCPTCDSAHLNFVDLCPDCGSFEIQRKPALHCFTCGHVDLQENFKRGEKLICGNCQTRLRHIGSDYDRPIENHLCSKCNAFFIDGEVSAICIACDKATIPSELKVQRIEIFQLSEMAIHKLRFQNVNPLQDCFTKLDLVSIELFKYNLTWMLDLSQRHPEFDFSLVAVKINNLLTTSETIGASKVFNVVDTIVSRISNALRLTDQVSRTGDEYFWLFLPKTNREGLKAVNDKLMELAALIEADPDSTLSLEVTSAYFPEDRKKGELTDDVFVRLAACLDA